MRGFAAGRTQVVEEDVELRCVHGLPGCKR
jgi:hypothetical protein